MTNKNVKLMYQSDVYIGKLLKKSTSLSVQKNKNPHTRFEQNTKIFLSNPVSRFPCQPSLPTPGSLSLLKAR